ncbi:MAG TPA: phosphoribosylformylglycinamidine synthase subunit PurL, partial [Firmicutes bacterium]|nr:phosphoribosylformylglycinamidine synthase subunit PurL [Bacillota bacterium]
MTDDIKITKLQDGLDHGLTEKEYGKILEILGRNPNRIELGIFSVMWSEHCSYKSSKIHLRKFKHSSPKVVAGPGENAGIIDIGNDYLLGMKIESHNHPSAVDPYEGAATGVGGILRDVFTMGLRPVANLNSLRFGNLDNSRSRYLMKHVVEGIAGYGNCTGIPTVGGELYFDECYQTNCLVNAMAVGIGKKGKIVTGIAKGEGNPVIYIGSKTGRDGIHGATFASVELSEESDSKRSSVQIADPFTEKLLIEACMELRDSGVVVGMQDMGAAGLTSSSVEMSSRGDSGIELDLDKVPVREEKMSGYEIMLSESQERMLVIVKKGKEKIAEEILKKWDLEFCVIGRVISGDRLKIKYKGENICDIPVKALTEDAPVYEREYKKPSEFDEQYDVVPEVKDYNELIFKLISSPTIASKGWVFHQYDYWVGTD